MMQGRIKNLFVKKSAVGLSVGRTRMTGVRIERIQDGRLKVTGGVSVDLPLDRQAHPAEIEDAVNQVMSGLSDDKASLALGLTPRQSNLHLFEPPFDQPSKVISILAYEAEPYFQTPVEEMVLDYLPLGMRPGTGSESKHRLGAVFGARPEIVSGLLDQISATGLEPDYVLPESLGLLLAGRQLFGDRPGQRLLVDLGADQTSLVLFDGERPVVIRSFFYGGSKLAEALAEATGKDIYEAERLKGEADLSAADNSKQAQCLKNAWQPIIMEIERTLAAGLELESEEPPIVVLSGGRAVGFGLKPFMAESLGLEVVGAGEFFGDDVFLSPELPGPGDDLIGALGLALAVLSPGYMPNLRQGDLAPSQLLTKFKSGLILGGAGLLLILIINLVGLVYSYHLQDQKHKAVKAEITKVFKETVPGVKRVVDPMIQLRQEIDKARLAANMGPQGYVLDILHDVSKLAGAHQGLRITNLSLSTQVIELQGEGGSYEVIDLFKTELAGLSYFLEALPGGARKDPTTGVLTFKITMKRFLG